MITVISCTNRKNSQSLVVAKHYVETLASLTDEKVELLSLESLTFDMFEDMYNPENHVDGLRKIQDSLLIPSDRFVFVVPEYNGSIPGILKLFIDACSVYKMKETFKIGTKKACLVGISAGRAGNLRGMIHLTGMLNYLNVQVLANQLPISNMHTVLDKEGNFIHEGTKDVIKAQLEEFVAY